MQHDWGGRGSDIVAAIAIAATVNTTLLALTAASRNLFGMARSGSLPRVIATVSRRTRSPWVAAVLGLGVAAAFAATADIALAASVTDFAVYAIFLVVNVAVIVLRRIAPATPRTIVVPLTVGRTPVTPLLAIATILIMIVRLEPSAWLLGIAAIVAGALAWLALNTSSLTARAVRSR
jgi:APA family basic amino acid/polyamine antiporter